MTVAVGIAFSLFPIVGVTTLLCFLAAAALRLNHPIIQIVNYLFYPVQIALMLPFYRAGERILGLPAVPLAPAEIAKHFGSDWSASFSVYGATILSGILIWSFIAPAVALILFKLSLPTFRSIAKARKRRRKGTTST